MTKRDRSRDPLSKALAPARAAGLAETQDAIECLKLKADGLTYEEIAERTGNSVTRAKALVHSRLDIVAEDLRELGARVLFLELQRIDRAYEVAYAMGYGGIIRDPHTGEPAHDEHGKIQHWIPDTRWATEARKLSEQRMKLMGFDVKTVRVEGMGGSKPETVAALPTDPIALALLEELVGGGAKVLPAKGESGAVDAEFVAVPVAAAQVVEDDESDLKD